MMNWLFGGSGGKDDKGSAPPTASANNNNNNSSSKMDIAALGSVAGNEPVRVSLSCLCAQRSLSPRASLRKRTSGAKEGKNH